MVKAFPFLFVLLVQVLGATSVHACNEALPCWDGQTPIWLDGDWKVRQGAPDTIDDQYLKQSDWIDEPLNVRWDHLGWAPLFNSATYYRQFELSQAYDNLYIKPGFSFSAIRILTRDREGRWIKVYENTRPGDFTKFEVGHQTETLVKLPSLPSNPEFIIQVSNATHVSGQVRVPPRLGPLDKLQNEGARDILFKGAIFGAFLLVGLINFVQWLGRREKLDQLFLSLCAILPALRLLDGAKLLGVIAPDSSLLINWYISWATYHGTGLTWTLFLYFAFPSRFRGWPIKLAIVYWFVCLSAFVFLEFHEASLFGQNLHLASGAIITYMAYLLTQEIRQNPGRTGLMAFGALVFALTVAFDLTMHYINQPLYADGARLGFLFFIICMTLHLGQRYTDALQQVADMAEELKTVNAGLETTVALRTADLLNANKQLEAQARTDSLTGLPNRRVLNDRLEEELNRCRRYGRAFTLAIVDVDYFKRINDSYGHDFGDEILIKLSSFLEGQLRKTDLVSRFGGEEFVILMPETSVEEAHEFLDRVRERVSLLTVVRDYEHVGFTISIGVAGSENAQKTAKELFRIADKALYEAKGAGRNQVISSVDQE